MPRQWRDVAAGDSHHTPARLDSHLACFLCNRRLFLFLPALISSLNLFFLLLIVDCESSFSFIGWVSFLLSLVDFFLFADASSSDAELTCDAETFHRECDEMLERLNDAVELHAVPAADERNIELDVTMESGVLTIALGAP